MTAPRHLWSGDWRRESAAAAQERAQRRVPGDERPPPGQARKLSAASRAAARLRRLRAHPARGTVLIGLATLVSAAAAYAIVSSLVSIAGGDSSHANHTSAPASHGAVGAPAAPAWLGVDTTDLLGANGAMVVNVSPGSPAAAAGLEPGDVITQINGRPVQTAADLESILASMNAGDRVEIQYDRGPAVSTAHATLAARPGNGP